MLHTYATGVRSSIRPPNKNIDESFRLRMISKLLNSPDYLGRNYNNKKDSTKYLKNKKICKIIDYLRYYDGKIIDSNVNNPNRKTTSILDDYIYLDGKNAIILENNPPSNLNGGNATTCNTHILDLQYLDKSRKCHDNDDISCENPYKSRKCNDNDDTSCKSRKCDDNDDMSCVDPDDYIYLDGKDANILQDRLTINLDNGNSNTCITNTDIIDLQDSHKSRKCNDNVYNSCENLDNYVYLDGKNAAVLQDKPPITLDIGNATTCNTDIIDLQDSRRSRKCNDNKDNSCDNPDNYIYLDGRGAIILEDNLPANLDGGNATTCNTDIFDLQASDKCNEHLDCECLENKTQCTAVPIINAVYNTAAKIKGIQIDSPYLDGGTADNCDVDIIDLEYSLQSRISNYNNS